MYKKMKSVKVLLSIVVSIVLVVSCKQKELPKPAEVNHNLEFNAKELSIGDNNSLKKIKGQVLYLPVYSTVPYFEKGRKYNLSAFVAIHNTDFNQTIRITKVLFFNNDGKLVSSYLTKDSTLQPLGATNFFVPERDQSGIGANFVVEWVADSLVSEPLIESVMVGLTNGQGVSFLSSGKVVREIK
jgi:hypothetical protein